MNAYPKHKLQTILNGSMRDITSRFAGIQLLEEPTALSDDICTVHTVLEGGRPAALLLCADTALLTRLARIIMHRENVTARDIEDVATEYFNIICGRIAAGIFQAAHVPSRFRSPCFRKGLYLPESDPDCRCVLHYTSGNKEGAHLIYMGLLSPDNPPSS